MSTVLTFCSLKARTMDRVQRMREAKQLKMTNPSKTRIYWVFFWRTVKSQRKEVELVFSLLFEHKLLQNVTYFAFKHSHPINRWVVRNILPASTSWAQLTTELHQDSYEDLATRMKITFKLFKIKQKMGILIQPSPFSTKLTCPSVLQHCYNYTGYKKCKLWPVSTPLN